MSDTFDFHDPNGIVQEFRQSIEGVSQIWNRPRLDEPIRLYPTQEDKNCVWNVGHKGIKRIAYASKAIRDARTSNSDFDAKNVADNLDLGIIYVTAAAERFIREIAKETISPNEKLQAFKEYNDLVDAYYNGIRKYDELHGTDSYESIKMLEEFRRKFRQSLVKDISQFDASPQKKWYQSAPTPRQGGRAPEWFERIIYNEIEDVNASSRNMHQSELDNYTQFGGSNNNPSLEDFEMNCAHCAPVTLATMYGSRLLAGSREKEYSRSGGRISTKHALPNVYDSYWQNVNNLDHLFDTIESDQWPEDTYAFVHWGYKDADYAHISVVGKINGRACIIEGQTQSVITRDAPGVFRDVTKNRAANESTVGCLDPNRLENIEFLWAAPAQNGTEFDRVESAWSAMYPVQQPHQKPQSNTSLAAPGKNASLSSDGLGR